MPTFHGLLVIDKPRGITSRDVVNRSQRWFPRGTRLGHTGTLDPLATGVLVLCVGSATRLAEYVQAMPKVYRAAIVLGGTNVLGGRGTYLGTVAGVILITLLQSILSVLQPQFWFAELGLKIPAETFRQIVFGIVIVAMLLLYGREKASR